VFSLATFKDILSSEHALHVFFQTFFLAFGLSLNLFLIGVGLALYSSTRNIPMAILTVLFIVVALMLFILGVRAFTQ
jgi:ABC-type Fe3+ transport system permease subunit